MKPINNIRTGYYYRAGSAKQATTRSNIHSNSKNKNNVTQIISTPIIHQQITRASGSFKHGSLMGMNNQQMGKMKRYSAKITGKSVQELYEENTQLKKQNHRLYQQVVQLRGKFQAKSKRNSERAKELDMQFQKQLYWGGSKTHLISGIKHQYSKLQSKYKQQSKQLQKLKISLMQTKIPQYQVHTQVLQMQNKKLSEKLKKIMENSMKLAGGSKKVMEVVIVEIQQKNKKLQDKLKQTEQQLSKIKQQIIQKQRKNQFLQKLLIQKDNNNHHFMKKIKKQQKQMNELKDKNQQLIQTIKEIHQKRQIHQQQIIIQCEVEKQGVKLELMKQINQLVNKTQQLLEDKRQLQNNMNRMKMTTSMINSGNSKIIVGDKKSFITKKQMPSQIQKQIFLNVAKLLDANEAESVNGYESGSSSNQSKELKKQKKPRQMKIANKKNSKNSKKMRKVQHADIEQTAELVKYRMIAAGVNSNDMRKYFDRTKESNQNPDIIDWEDEHISMLEVKKILKSSPFNINQQSAHLLARYLIEDCNEEYVYCDQINENKRQIIKSIIKSLVGEYHLLDQQTQKQMEQFKLKYQQSFFSALKTYYPQGKVHKKKFMDVLTGMGLELNQKTLQCILAKVAQKSQSLAELQFGILQNL